MYSINIKYKNNTNKKRKTRQINLLPNKIVLFNWLVQYSFPPQLLLPLCPCITEAQPLWKFLNHLFQASKGGSCFCQFNTVTILLFPCLLLQWKAPHNTSSKTTAFGIFSSPPGHPGCLWEAAQPAFQPQNQVVAHIASIILNEFSKPSLQLCWILCCMWN